MIAELHQFTPAVWAKVKAQEKPVVQAT